MASDNDKDMGKAMGDDMLDADLAALDGMGMGGEFEMAGDDTVDADMAALDGKGVGGEVTEAQMEAEMQVEAAMMDGVDLDGVEDDDGPLLDF